MINSNVTFCHVLFVALTWTNYSEVMMNSIVHFGMISTFVIDCMFITILLAAYIAAPVTLPLRSY